jgi:uncharacterized Zn finger protein
MLKNLIELNCENCGTLMAAVIECHDGISTYRKCHTCGHYHNDDSDFATSIYLELQNLEDMQAEEETTNSLMNGGK